MTKGYATEQNDGFSYNVKFLKCTSSIWERNIWIADHAFIGTTYQKGIKTELRDVRNKKGFYNGNTR